MDRAKTRITVAGAGAFGLSTALGLARAGFAVSVFDPSPVNASSVAAGMLAPVFETLLDTEDDAHFDMLMSARNLWLGFAQGLGLLLDRRGAMAVGETAFLGRLSDGFRRLGAPVQELSRAQLQVAAPGLNHDLRQGLMTSEDWRLETAKALTALRAAARSEDVTFHEKAASGLEDGDRLVIATGAGQDLAALAPQLKVLTPIKGQILRGRGQGFDGVLRLEGGYCVGGPGELAVGATMESGFSDLTPSLEARLRFETLAHQTFPELVEVFQAQVGVRAASPDGLPMIGRTEDPRVFLAVGARRNGWLLAPLAAQIITACLTEGEVGPYGASLNPMRFSNI